MDTITTAFTTPVSQTNAIQQLIVLGVIGFPIVIALWLWYRGQQ